jgi:hypothetical protein
MPDAYQSHQANLADPGFKAAAIAPHDTNDLPDIPRALYVGVGGDIVAICKNDTTSVTFKAVPQGSILPVSVKRVLATGTTASQILGIW